jgi:hypothetical protein
MHTTATAAAFVLDDLGLVCEMFAAEVLDRAPVLSPEDVTRIVLLSADLKRRLLECENNLPKLPKKKQTVYSGPKPNKRAFDQAISTETEVTSNGRKR